MPDIVVSVDGRDIYISEGNFEFFSPLYPEVVKHLKNAESNARTYVTTACRSLRLALEQLCSYLEHENNITVSADTKLIDRTRVLADLGVLYNDGHKYKCNEYLTESGHINSSDQNWYDFIRWLGNNDTHIATNPDWPVLNYDNLIKALGRMFNVLLAEYDRCDFEGKLPREEWPDKFDENIMPIGENLICLQGSYIPVDTRITFCQKEYLTCKLNYFGYPDSYSIIRIYKKADRPDDKERFRETVALTEAMELSVGPFNGKVVYTGKIPASDDNEFYLIEYRFVGGFPIPLADILEEGLSEDERRDLCRSVAEILRNFHTLQNPIYHRTLTYDSVYVCRNADKSLTPSIIKMDSAKITSGNYGTVRIHLENSTEVYVEIASLNKYMDVKTVKDLLEKEKGIEAAETKQAAKKRRSASKAARKAKSTGAASDNKTDRTVTDEDNADPFKADKAAVEEGWEKVDIFSLGILFGDILSGTTQNPSPKTDDYLRSQGFDDYADLVASMVSTDISERPTAEDAITLLEAATPD